jgi:hypothetical protein
MAKFHVRGIALLAMLILLVTNGCRSKKTPPVAPTDLTLEKMELLDTGQEKLRIGAPEAFGNLAVFPVFSSTQHDIGPVLALQDALAKGVAEVREVGAGGENVESAGGATVNKLVIENKGDLPVYALAGTVVKGGNQDRQIAQDFVIAKKSTVPVDAFCVEQGRWTGERNGVATQGKFRTLDQLATAKVRAAGQHKSDQSQVWSEVAKVNAANGKQAPSGSLLASLDDGEIARRRAALADRVASKLRSLEPGDKLVGFGYAVNGSVKGVRWF